MRTNLTRVWHAALLTSSLCFSVAILADEHVHEDIVYVSHDGIELTYDYIRPANANGAAIIAMASGSWNSRKVPASQTAEWFDFTLEEGYTVFAVRHRSAPTYKVPQAVEDVQLAIRHIRHHAEDYGIDPTRMASYGFSSGGHLALMIALDSDDGDASSEDGVAKTANHVAAAVAFFPPVSLVGRTGPNPRYHALDFDEEKASSVSPIEFVDEADPPVFLIHGTEDKVVPVSNSLRMHDALTKVEVANELMILDGAGHGGFTDEQQADSKAAILAFLAKHLSAS